MIKRNRSVLNLKRGDCRVEELALQRTFFFSSFLELDVLVGWNNAFAENVFLLRSFILHVSLEELDDEFRRGRMSAVGICRAPSF